MRERTRRLGRPHAVVAALKPGMSLPTGTRRPSALYRPPSARSRWRPGIPSWHRSWPHVKAGTYRLAPTTTTTTRPWPSKWHGRPTSLSWPTRLPPSPTIWRTRPHSLPQVPMKIIGRFHTQAAVQHPHLLAAGPRHTATVAGTHSTLTRPH